MNDESNFNGEWLKPITMDVTFQTVDPDMLALLFGAKPADKPDKSHYSVEIYHPIKRTFWQWLRRKPRQFDMVSFPFVEFGDMD